MSLLMFLILKISKKDFHCCRNSMHVNWNRFQSLMIFIECWCLTLSSLFKHNVNGHEFNTSTENKVTRDVTLKNEGMCVCVCVYVYTFTMLICTFYLLCLLLFFLSEIQDLFKMISDHTFNRNQAVLLLLLFQPLERKKKKNNSLVKSVLLEF